MNPSTLADAGLQALIDKAITDLAKRFSISADQIRLLDAKPVIWPDASLGCPQPGMAYVQVQEDRLLLRLQAGDQIYEYHSGGTRDPFLCLKSGKDTNPPPQIDLLNFTPHSEFTSNSTPTSDPSTPPREGQ